MNRKKSWSLQASIHNKKVEQIDTVSGVAVADPYRWLENDTSRETADWVAAENEVTAGYLKNIRSATPSANVSMSFRTTNVFPLP